MNTNTNTVAPTGMIQGQVDLNEVSSNSRVKRQGIVLLTHGINLGIIYGFVDLGTHVESFQGQAPKKTRKLKLLFEHPQLKQLFYEDDTVVRSTVSSKECSFSINDKSFLKKVIDTVSGRVMSVQDASKYPVASLIGQRIGVNIVHTPKLSDPTVFYEKVESVVSANGLQVPHPFEPENKPMYFYIDRAGVNFTSQNFANLPKYFREKIMDSDEGKAHISRGGKFSENPQQTQGQQQAQVQQQAQQHYQGSPQQPVQQAAAASPIIMLPTAQFSREQYHTSGWSDAQLVQNGLAQWSTPPAPQQPSGPVISGPPAPGAPAPTSFLDSSNDDESDLPF